MSLRFSLLKPFKSDMAGHDFLMMSLPLYHEMEEPAVSQHDKSFVETVLLF